MFYLIGIPTVSRFKCSFLCLFWGICFLLWNPFENSSVIKQKGEPQNGRFKKTKHGKFSEKASISYSLIRTRTSAYQGVRNVCFFWKFGVLCFLETPVLRFGLLRYYRRFLPRELGNFFFCRILPEALAHRYISTKPVIQLQFREAVEHFPIKIVKIISRKLKFLNFYLRVDNANFLHRCAICTSGL